MNTLYYEINFSNKTKYKAETEMAFTIKLCDKNHMTNILNVCDAISKFTQAQRLVRSLFTY